MKHYILVGFAAYTILQSADNTISVRNNKTGKTVVPKGGEVKLKCSEDAGDYIAGTEYKIALKTLGEWGTEGETSYWLEGDGTTPAPVATTTPKAEPTEAETLAAANKAKLAELAKAMKNASDEVMANLESPEIATFSAKLSAAKKAHDEFKASIGGKVAKPKKEKVAKVAKVVSPEELASAENLNVLKAAIETAKTTFNTALEVHNGTEGWTKFGKAAKTGGTGKGSGSKERVLDYDKAQTLRKDYAEMIAAGKTRAEAVNALNESTGLDKIAINRCIDYRQHLVKKGDVMHIPFNPDFHNRYAGETPTVTANEWYKKIAKA